MGSVFEGARGMPPLRNKDGEREGIISVACRGAGQLRLDLEEEIRVETSTMNSLNADPSTGG